MSGSEAMMLGDTALTVMEGEPRARDLDLARWLEFKDPHKIRKLIERWSRVPEGSTEPPVISPVSNPATVARFTKSGKPRGEVASVEYWLSEPEAIFILSKSETPKAVAVTKAVIAVFMAARRGLLTPPVPPALPAPESSPRDELLDEIETIAAIRGSGSLALCLAQYRQIGDGPADHAALLAELGVVLAWYASALPRLGPDSQVFAVGLIERTARALVQFAGGPASPPAPPALAPRSPRARPDPWPEASRAGIVWPGSGDTEIPQRR